MDKIDIAPRRFGFGGEETTVSVVDGVFDPGDYDLDLERVAMGIQGGFNEGLGVMMIILNDFVNEGEDLNQVLDVLEREVHYTAEKKTNRKFSNYMYSYFALDPDEKVRVWAIQNGQFSARIWKKLINDPVEFVSAWALSMADKPMALIRSKVTDADQRIRAAVARNPNLPIEDLFTLYNDSSTWVMREFYEREEKGTLPEVLATKIRVRSEQEDITRLEYYLEIMTDKTKEKEIKTKLKEHRAKLKEAEIAAEKSQKEYDQQASVEEGIEV